MILREKFGEVTLDRTLWTTRFARDIGLK